jgi:hypothetical protein
MKEFAETQGGNIKNFKIAESEDKTQNNKDTMKNTQTVNEINKTKNFTMGNTIMSQDFNENSQFEKTNKKATVFPSSTQKKVILFNLF